MNHRDVGANVKSYRAFYHEAPCDFDLIGEDAADALARDEIDLTWDALDRIACSIGFEGVWSEGRSGGWAVPYFAGRREVDLDDVRECTLLDCFRALAKSAVEDAEARYLMRVHNRASRIRQTRENNYLAEKVWRY